MMKVTIVMAAALLVLGSCQQSQKQDEQVQKSETMNNTEDYTFKLDDKVTRKKVTFKNRYGISVTADLYTPKNIENQKLAALIVSGPFGAIKEQSSGLYANQLASRGFCYISF